jgi:hypothetical protein
MAETEDESISLDDTLESLKRNAKAVDVYFQETRKKLKDFQKKLAEESGGLNDVPLQPRTRMMKWLTDHGLPVECTFTDFFEVFVEEHKKEHRLDLSKRSICLNENACILFGIKGRNPDVCLYDLLERLNVLYY